MLRLLKPAPSSVKFSDLARHWAEVHIQQALTAKLISGYSDHTFRPDNSITRAEFIVMLIHALKPKAQGVPLTFTDHAKIGTWAQQELVYKYAEAQAGDKPSNFPKPLNI
ncbi:S-layer homology domain-containing protein [Paenibacillus eucommiae]|uniref:SLH domain-containing protein n=1 Tax=Paenibacillus eucommiae TaxID=1355755 RepID=A0ABS4IUF1_9BACL|nr:S-layer homology domain-containing protein [Paenibacillus eucommiae]MBP1991221.1 hypothetical protein [Paenibacillus eucommiae]